MRRTKFTTPGVHDVIVITASQKNALCTEELHEFAQSLDTVSLTQEKLNFDKGTLVLTFWHKIFTLGGCLCLEFSMFFNKNLGTTSTFDIANIEGVKYVICIHLAVF